MYRQGTCLHQSTGTDIHQITFRTHGMGFSIYAYSDAGKVPCRYISERPCYCFTFHWVCVYVYILYGHTHIVILKWPKWIFIQKVRGNSLKRHCVCYGCLWAVWMKSEIEKLKELTLKGSSVLQCGNLTSCWIAFKLHISCKCLELRFVIVLHCDMFFVWLSKMCAHDNFEI